MGNKQKKKIVHRLIQKLEKKTDWKTGKKTLTRIMNSSYTTTFFGSANLLVIYLRNRIKHIKY